MHQAQSRQLLSEYIHLEILYIDHQLPFPILKKYLA